MKFRAILAVACAAVTLSGCWESTTPFITVPRIDDPGIVGEYTEGTNSVTITKSGDYWTKQDANSTARFLRFDLVKPGWYILQQDSLSGGEVQYGIINKKADGTVVRYPGDCINSVAALKGVTRDEGGDCQFASYEALVEAAKIYVAHLEKGGSVAVGTYVPK
ncbi:MAG: hypothetical protein KDD90_07945 [Sphingomonadaceae bacterium]|nr:hypothetical protein [Sphingomonadaceae bacterium]